MTESGLTRQLGGVHARNLSIEAKQEVNRPADFRAIFETEFDYVWRSLKRLGIRDRDLEDVTHDVFLQVYRHFDQYDGSRPLHPWLFGFAFRVAAGHRRRARNRLEVLGTRSVPVDPRPSAVEQLENAELLELAQAALDKLELGRRAVFILHELDGYSIPEVASALVIPLNTAYSRLRLAREQFAAALDRLRRGRGES